MPRKRNNSQEDLEWIPSSGGSEDSDLQDSSSDPVSSESTLILPPTPAPKKKRKLKLEKKLIPVTTQITNLSDLIKLGEMYDERYEFDCVINIKTLHNMLDPLRKLNALIGLDSFKNAIIDQLIYQLTSMREIQTKNTASPTMLHTVLFGPAGVGKCLGYDTPIRMYDGVIKPVQDIKVGDFIMGDDSTARTILSVTTGQEQMYQIEQEYGDLYIVNESHILSLKLDKNPQIREKRVEQGYQVTWFTSEIECSQMVSWTNCSKEIAYQVAKSFSETLPKKGSIIDICVKDYLKRDIRWKAAYKGYKVGVYYPKKEVPNDPYLVGKWLREHGRSSIPLDYLINDRETRSMLLAGLLNTAPHFTEGGVWEIQCDTILANNIIELVRSLGYRAKFTEGNSLLIEIIQNDKLMYNINVVPTKVDTYYGFEIDGNKRFMLGDFTVTHNTTVSQIFSELYCKMGVLSKGHLVVAKRADLVAKYLGQTASKTLKVLESAKGGILLIDEVYSLGPSEGDGDSFSKECIDTINQFLSENAHDFICIIAGYKEEVEKSFFSRNPGLPRRFPYRYTIEGYTPNEMFLIFKKFVSETDWSLLETAIGTTFFQVNKDSFPCYGGDLKVFFDNCKVAHSRRTFILPQEHWKVLTTEDIEKGFEIYKTNKEINHKNDIPNAIKHMYI